MYRKCSSACVSVELQQGNTMTSDWRQGRCGVGTEGREERRFRVNRERRRNVKGSRATAL